MKGILKIMVCIGIAAIIMNPHPLVSINIVYNLKEAE